MSTSAQDSALEDNSQPSTLASAEPQIHGRPRVLETTDPASSGPSSLALEEQLEVDAGAPVATIVAAQEMATPSTHGGNGHMSSSHETVGQDAGPSNRRMERSPGYIRRTPPEELGEELRKCDIINRRLIAQRAETSERNIEPSRNQIPVQATISLGSTPRSSDEVNHPRPTRQSSTTQSGITSNENSMPSSHQIPRRIPDEVEPRHGNQPRTTRQSSTTQSGITSNENNMPSSHRTPGRTPDEVEHMHGNRTRGRGLVSIDTILHAFDDANHASSSTQNAETPNENAIENRDTLLAPPNSMGRHNSSFLTVLDTMMHMFQLEGNSEEEIETFFNRKGLGFPLLFIKGVVDVLMPPGTAKELVEKRIGERLGVFKIILELDRNVKTAEELRELCFHTGGCILDLVGMGRKEDDPEPTSVHLYRTDLDFVEELIFFSTFHPQRGMLRFH